jgi:4-amino-4-deoxy-L-arabinose transferase-like glycosyltransferase
MLGLVYLVALFMPLMENDSAQFAIMAMRMAQESDFIHLFKDGIDYLDKPHMHYWLAALSFKLFGYTAWAYRLPSFLALVAGAYALYRLGTQLKSKELGVWSAVVFL